MVDPSLDPNSPQNKGVPLYIIEERKRYQKTKRFIDHTFFAAFTELLVKKCETLLEMYDADMKNRYTISIQYQKPFQKIMDDRFDLKRL